MDIKTALDQMAEDAVGQAVNPQQQKVATIAEQMDALILQLDTAENRVKRVLKELELIRKTVG